MQELKKIEIKGYRSIQEMSLELRSLNVLIGANGAGKSNLVSFFKMFNEMMDGRLQQFISTTGRAQANLYLGPKVTRQIEATLEFAFDDEVDIYYQRLLLAAADTLVFAAEDLSFAKEGMSVGLSNPPLGAGHQETRIGEICKGANVPSAFRFLHYKSRTFHFHDMSSTARVRQFCYVGNHQELMSDAANLAAILYRLRQENEPIFRRIVGTIKQVAPFFDNFVLEPEGPSKRDIILNWRQRNSDLVFGPHQLSDGTLRAICLITLLLQPAQELPNLIVIDEPELGLHPFALNVVASLIQMAASRTQLLVSTQSSSLLDNFEPEDIVVVERNADSSTFSRPDAVKLRDWLQDYGLGEVWEKNIIGGGPH